MNRNFLVTGSYNGLGEQIVKELAKIKINDEESDIGLIYCYDKQMSTKMDVREPWEDYLKDKDISVLINCAGINGLKWIDKVTDTFWDEIMDTNAKGILKMSQALLSDLKQNKGTILNITSNAAWTPMRCSIAYNASKAAAGIMTKQMARELSGEITVFGIAPNYLEGTGMSKKIISDMVSVRHMTEEQAIKYNKNSLPFKQATSINALAEFIAYLLSNKQRHQYLSGCILPYGL